MLKGHTADAAVIMEPTELKMGPAHSGALAFSVRVPGKSAHACVREEGVSAIEKFIPLFNGLRALESQRNEPSRQFYYSLGATSMDGWTTFRMTPDVFKRLAES